MKGGLNPLDQGTDQITGTLTAQLMRREPLRNIDSKAVLEKASNKVGQFVRITHKPTGMLLADGPIGWGITPFEANYYISRKYLRTTRFRVNFLPGLCPYKFLYVWLDLDAGNGAVEKNLGWMYWLPNPLLPFIWFRVALPGSHPSLIVERYRVEKK